METRRRVWISVGLAVLTAAVYAPVRRHGFVAFDDQMYVYANPRVAGGLTWEGVRWAFTTGRAGNWHPLTWLSHMLDVSLFGMSAGAHHATNVILHVANTLLLFDVLRRMTGAVGKSAFVAALFAVHPLHVESVAWVAERKDVLSTLFWMLTLEAYVAWVRAPKASRYALVVAAFAAGLMSKPMLVTLPFALLLLDRWPLGRTTDARSLRPLIVEKIPLFALSAASCVVTWIAQRGAGAVAGFETHPLGERFANALVSYVAYVGNMLWPTGLSAMYVRALPIPASAWVGAAVALAAVTLLAARQSRRRPWFVVGWLWFLGTLVPAIGLVQVGAQSMADRYTYVPLIGLFVVVAWGAAELLDRERPWRIAVGGSAAVAILACAVLARRQVDVWTDTETLWRHAVDVDPTAAGARINLGDCLCALGRFDEAVAEIREILRVAPDSAQARNNLACVLLKQGKTDLALSEFREALRLRPGLVQAHDNLGLALRQAGRTDEAAAQFREAVRLAPDSAGPRHSLAVTLSELGRADDAVTEMTEAVRLAPDDPSVRCDLGRMLAGRGDVAGAVREFEAAARLTPDMAQARHNLAVAYFRQDRLDDALREIGEALRLAPDDGPSHCDLALMLERRGDLTGAARELETALRLDPRDDSARAALARLTGRGVR